MSNFARIVAVGLIVMNITGRATNSTYLSSDKIKEKVIAQLVNTKWVTDKLAEDISPGHYISDREMNEKSGFGQHSVRIVVGKGNKIKHVMENLETIYSAIQTDNVNDFRECTFSKAFNSGEYDFFFGAAGREKILDIDTAEYKGQKWQENKDLKVIGVRFCPGKQSPAHIYPLIGK